MPQPRRGRAAAPPKDEGLKLDDAHAIAILEKAVEYEVLDEDKVPENKRQRATAAAEQIDLLIEAWNNGINPYSDEEEKAEMGKAIQDILDLAGVEIDENGEVTYGELPDLEEVGGDDDNEGGSSEAAFDVEDIIEGYADLSAAARCKAIDGLELDMDDDDDYNKAVAIYEWEEAQEKPSSRVLNFLDEMLPQDGEAGAEAEGDESAEEAGDGDGEEPWQEPWTKDDGAPANYGKMDAVAVKKHLDKLLAKEELSEEMLDYVRDYENEATGKPPRKRILDHIEKLRPEIGAGGGDEPEEAPARSGRPSNVQRPARGGRLAGIGRAKEEEPEPVAVEPGIILVTVEGEEEPYTCYGVQMAAGCVADALAAGATSIQVDAG